MTLTPFVSGDPRVCRRLLAQGGRILFLGDSITSQLESLPCRLFPSVDGFYALDNLSFNYAQTAWTTAPSTLSNNRSLVLGTCRTISFNGGTSGSTASTWRMNAGFVGFRFFGANSDVNQGALLCANEDWFRNRLATEDVRVRLFYYAEPDGVTTEDIRVDLQIGGVDIVSSDYLSNYAASETLRYVDLIIPQGTSIAAANTIRWIWRYRPSTATPSGKVFRFVGLVGAERATLPARHFITFSIGEGGASALSYSSTYNDAFYSTIADAFNPRWCFWALGQNSVGSVTTHRDRMHTAIGRLEAVAPNCEHLLWSTPGNSPSTGWEIGEKELVTGNAAAAELSAKRVHLNTHRMMPSNAAMDLGKRSDWLSIADGTPLRLGECYRYPSSGSNYYVVKTAHSKTATTPDADTTNFSGAIAFTGTVIGYDSLGSNNIQLIGDGIHPSTGGRFVMLQALRGLVYMAAEMGGVFPTEPQVQVGVEYGPLGNDLTGTAVLADAAQLEILNAISGIKEVQY
jgi:hypothetical protein